MPEQEGPGPAPELEMPERGLTALATRRPVGVTMVALTVVLFGFISFRLLPRNLMPDISYPSVTVRTQYPGAAPIDVETRVSRRLEEVLSQVRDLRRVSSISRAEVSDIILEFAWETEMSQATTEVREKVSQAVLPDEAEAPTFLRYDPSLDPILQIGLYPERVANESEEEALIRLRIFAEDEFEQAIESIPGIAGVRVRGGLEKELRIDVKEDALRAKAVSLESVATRIGDENLNLSSGILYEGNQSRAVRTVNEFKNLEEIRGIILRRDASTPIRLRDVAEVSFGYKDPEVITRIDGNPCIKIDIFKEADANIVEVAALVKQRVFGTESQQQAHAAILAAEQNSKNDGTKDGEEAGTYDGAKDGKPSQTSRPDYLATRLPPGVGISLMSDQSRFIENALDDVRRTVLTGGFLAILILFAFLRSAWFTLAVGLSIPLSVMAAFVVMHLAGVSLNMMSLGGLALGIGMLVDNSVVVLESIFRCREDGDDPKHAAVRGTRLVASAVTASTLTTVAVFFPIVFVEGVAGQIFRDQAIAVVISLLASLVAALYFIPALVCRGMGGRKAARGKSTLRRYLATARTFSSWPELRDRFSRWRTRWRLFFLPLLTPLFLAFFVVQLFLEFLRWCILWGSVIAGSILREFLRLVAPLRSRASSSVMAAFDKMLLRIHDMYLRVLAFALAKRSLVIVATLAVSTLSFLCLRELDNELIPEVHQGEFTVEIRLPRSTRIEQSDRILRPWEQKLSSPEKFPEIASVTTTIGVEKDELSEADEGEHSAKMLVRLKPSRNPLETEERVKARIRTLFRNSAFESLEIVHPVLFSFKTPIEVEVSGYNLEELGRITDELVERMEQLDEIKDVKSSLARGHPEVQLALDRELLSRYDIGIGQIGTLVRQKIQGEVPSYFTLGDRKVPIRVRLREQDRDSLAELNNMSVYRSGDVNLRLKDVIAHTNTTSSVSLPIGEGPAEIRRIAHQRAAVVTANLAGMSLGGATESLERTLGEIDYPPEFSVGFGGQKEEMDVALSSLQRALLLAVFLVYAVMAMQFESLVQPLVIIVAIPLALVGVFPVLFLLSKPLSIVVFIGIIVLAGIVVNNAIVLIDSANQLKRRDGLSMHESLMRAGELRLRPILMTTATTVLGLLPLTGVFSGIQSLEPLFGSGQGEEIRAPLAITVVAGLMTSTVLTLVIVPVFASLFDSALGLFRHDPPLAEGEHVG